MDPRGLCLVWKGSVVGLVLIPELRKPQDKEKDSEGRGNA